MSGRKVMILSVLAISVLAALFMHSANAASPAPQSFVTSFIPPWYDIAIIAVLIVMMIAALIYAASYALDSPNGRSWARVQIYEALIGILLIAIFFGLYSMMFLNPGPSLSGVKLLPNTCTGAASSTIFNVSACDMGSFISISKGYFGLLYGVSYIAGLSPGFGVKVNVPPDSDGQGFSIKLDSIFPMSAEELLGMAFNALLFMILLNEVQLVLLSGAIFFIALFMAIGLIAWVFGISRSFGGAMIAFGLGLGIVFPLLVSVTYGFIDTQILASLSNPTSLAGALTAIFALGPTLVIGLFATYLTGSFSPVLGTLMLQYGYVIAGLTFIPFLNFAILDAFIVDFSKVMGERVSFMALLSNLV
ncbi:MAG: hypothetical protein QXW10_01185 [Candidatus Micrarchaeaceae archaeon]